MICPIVVTYSLMVGAVLSYGIMWPLIENKQGEWFPNGTKYGEGGSNVAGLSGYKVGAAAWYLQNGLCARFHCMLLMLAACAYLSTDACASSLGHFQSGSGC